MARYEMTDVIPDAKWTADEYTALVAIAATHLRGAPPEVRWTPAWIKLLKVLVKMGNALDLDYEQWSYIISLSGVSPAELLTHGGFSLMDRFGKCPDVTHPSHPLPEGEPDQGPDVLGEGRGDVVDLRQIDAERHPILDM